ncbi:hypothetical protein [Caenispirillum salinarum]|uniref:hypothetical protein n=1 Tax=Caenispirillum salinarum TaxID=859058 RepID=UPI003850086C
MAACTKRWCENFGARVSEFPDLYNGFGHASGKSRRERCQCRACGTTFSRGVVKTYQQKKYVNPFILAEVVNGSSVQAITRKKPGITPRLFYDRLKFIHRRMLAFEAHRIEALKTLRTRHFSIATDFQDYIVNWPTKDDRRTTQLTAIGSADNLSGFVFALDLAYDPSIEPWDRFKADLEAGDLNKHPAHWRINRFRLPEFLTTAEAAHQAAIDAEYEKAEKEERKAEKRRKKAGDGGDASSGSISPEGHRKTAERSEKARVAILKLMSESAATMRALEAVRQIIDTMNLQRFNAAEFGPPTKGALVDKTYTAFGHYAYLDRILPDKAFLMLFIDDDGSSRAAALTMLAQRFKARRASLSVVKIAKEMTNDQRTAASAMSGKAYKAFRDKLGLSKSAMSRRLFVYMNATEFKVKNNTFPFYQLPVSTKYEPLKSVGIVHMPDFSDEDYGLDKNDEMFVEILDRPSLHGIDSFFSLLRERAMYAGRGVSAPGRTSQWYRHHAYNPAYMHMVLDIMRVYYNWVEPRPRAGAKYYFFESDGEKRTPAQRLGIAKAPVRVETILGSDWEAKL